MGDHRVAPERGDARQVRFDDCLTDIQVWNDRQHVSTLTVIAIGLAGKALIPFCGRSGGVNGVNGEVWRRVQS